MLTSDKTIVDHYALRLQRGLLKNHDFTIISNDCWGAEVYRHFDLQYNTPFVGLFVMAPCYLTLLSDMKFYLNSALEFVQTSKYKERNTDRITRQNFYPIGLLQNEVEIHFLHYHSEIDAFEKWNRRVHRMNWHNLFVKFDASKDGATDTLIERFERLPFQFKICLSDRPYPEFDSILDFDNWTVDGAKMYRISLEKLNILGWLNKGEPEQTFFSKVYFELLLKNNKFFL